MRVVCVNVVVSFCVLYSLIGENYNSVEAFLTTCGTTLTNTRNVNVDSHHVLNFFGGGKRNNKKVEEEEERTYPESKAATYELLKSSPVGMEFGNVGMVRQLLKQTQLEKRKLKVIYDAKKHGWDAKKFHQMVDGKGSSVVLCKVRGRWIGGYNPRGWASLGGSRPSIAAFLFYQKFPFGWQKLRSKGNGGLAISRDEFDQGIYFGADSLIIPLSTMGDSRNVASRLGAYFESGPENKSTLLPIPGANARCEELQVIAGVYAPGEDIPNSGGVTDLGLY